MSPPSRESEQCEAGRLALGVRQRRVAEAALPTRGDDDAHPGFTQVDQFVAVRVLHQGADRHQKFQVCPADTVAVVAHTRLAVCGAVGPAVVCEQGGDLGVADENDLATATAIAAVRAGQGLELLPLDRDAAVATVP